MVSKQQIHPTNKPSQLSKFNLGFEYDKSFAEVRRDIKVRADKSL